VSLHACYASAWVSVILPAAVDDPYPLALFLPVLIALLADPSSWYFRDLARAAEARGHRCVRGEFSRLSGRVGLGRNQVLLEEDPLGTADVVVVRSMPPGSLEQVVLRMDFLSRLEQAGTLVMNPPKGLECAIDKYLTTSRLAAAGLPVPPTICCQTAEQGLAAIAELGGDVVIKPLFGSEGRGIVRVSDPDLGWRVCTTLERLGAALYVQQFIDHGGCDYRVMVLGDRVLGGMRRRSAIDFRTNVARQGTGEPYAPTEREGALALAAAAAVGLPFAGIDLMYDRAGNVTVIEVNGVPGWRAFATVNQQDVADQFVRYLEAQRTGISSS
jgi:ribosomal protein S6--L-glutamate ligase